jgi:hypothetical protein
VKTNKIIYWIATGLLCLMMLGSAGMYIFNHQAVSEIFKILGFPVISFIRLRLQRFWV